MNRADSALNKNNKLLHPLPVGIAKAQKTNGCDNTEHDRNRLPQSNRTGKGGAGKNYRCEKGQLDTVELSVLDTIAAENICWKC